MGIVAIEDIRESNCLKKNICESCMEQLKGVLDDEQLKRFEESFKKATDNVILGDKRNCHEKKIHSRS